MNTNCLHIAVILFGAVVVVNFFSVPILPKIYLLNSAGGKEIKINSKLGSTFSSGKTRVLFFFGTRAEITKMAMVIQTFRSAHLFETITVYTGQHPDLIQPCLELFNITVDITFHHILVRNQSVPKLIAKIMSEAERMEIRESDIWMVQGDTSTALAIATVAFHRGLRIGHIEAGLRTYDMYSPFPEEFNRKTISSIATFHFAPTENNKVNLIKEGIPEERIFVTGNTVIDAIKYVQMQNKTRIPDFLRNVNLRNLTLILLTLHRRENIKRMAEFYSTIQKTTCLNCLFIVPVHPNPVAKEAALNACKTDSEHFLCVAPLAYEELHWIMNKLRLILTDSGGLQEEATWYQVPVLILRNNTERMEVVTSGLGTLVGTNLSLLQEKMKSILNAPTKILNSRTKSEFPFGTGNASKQVLDVLVKWHQSFPNLQNQLGRVDRDQNSLDKIILRMKSFLPVTIGVVLQVYKRNSLYLQLEAVANQTLRPTTVVILQNGYHVDVSKTILEFRRDHPNTEVQHIASSKNLRFHGRFYIAYMMKETYVSIWDDDVFPKSQWLEYCVEYSKSRGNALVGTNGATLIELTLRKERTEELVGKNDYVGHTWTLPREFLTFYLQSEKPTLYTGEDIQLSFSLQMNGIDSVVPKQQMERSVKNLQSFMFDYSASYRRNQAPRILLICKLLKLGFQTLRCSNCKDQKVLDDCLTKLNLKAKKVESSSQETDQIENRELTWSKYNLTVH